MRLLKHKGAQSPIESIYIEEEPGESRKKFQTLFNLMPDPVVIVDGKGNFLAVNDRMEEVTGFSKQELLGKNFPRTKIVAAKSKALLTKNLVKVMVGKHVAPYEVDLVTKDGKKLTAEINAAKIGYEGKLANIVIFRDITERKKAKETLKESENYLKTMLDSIFSGVLVIDEKTHEIVDANPKALKTIGASRERVIGKVCHSFICPAEKGKCPISDLGQTVDKSERVLLRANGERIPILKTVTTIMWRGHKYLIENIIDIIERKQVEEALRESEERYRKQFDEALDAILLADAETGIIIDCNRAASELVGREKSELVGKHQRILHPPEEIEGEFSRTFKQHLKEKEGQILETQIITKRGEIKDVAIKANVFELGDKKLIQGIFRDITESKKAEEELKESEEKYRKLINGMNDTVWVIDFDGKFIDVNDAAVKILGYSREELLSMGPYDIDTSLTEEEIRDLIKQMPADEIQVFETTHTTIDGKKIPVEISSSLVAYQGKQAILSIARDITERKRVEDELARERDLLHVLMDNIPDTIYFKDTDSRFVKNNKAHAKVLGINDPKEAIGKTDSDFFTEEHARDAYADEQKIMKTGQPLIGKVEKPVRGKDGKYRWVSSTKVPIKDQGGRVIGMVGISRNITESKRVEEELAHERDLLHALMDNIPDTIYFKDTASRFTRINKAQAKMLGIKNPEEAIGKTDSDFFTEEHARDAYADEQKIMEKGQPLINKVEKTERPDRYFLWTSTTKVPIKDKEGQVIGMVGMSRDITERKQLQEKLEDYSEHLEELVKKRTRQLKKAQEQLLKAERLAAIGETAAMVGHDLRNPLQVIVSTVYLAKKSLKDSLPPGKKFAGKHDIGELLVTVEEQLQYMDKIVSDVQDYARPLKPELVETSLHQLINDTLLTITVPETVEVSIMIPEDFPKLMVDPALMKRVFTNLVKNALQAMPDGGQLTIRPSKTEETAFISVQDTGVGIPEENLHKLFRPLFTTKSKGSGFGLAACKRLVEAHNGSITFESKVGRGSTFTVKIPLRKEVS